MRTLTRRGALGIRFEFRKSPAGVRVLSVTEDTAARRADIRPGDVLSSAGDTLFTDEQTFRRWAARLRAGTVVRVAIERDGTTLEPRELAIDERPRERAPGVAHRYTQASLGDGVLLRVIVSQPEHTQSSRARILALPGYRRDSCDWPASADYPLRRWVEDLARAGFTVVRVERRGLGDSEGDGDAQGFFEERDDILEAAQQINDETRELGPWLIHGYSLGALSAPIAAQRLDAQGVCVWGSGIDTWTEYLDALLRRRMAMLGAREGEVERAVRAQQALTSVVHMRGGAVSEALAMHPALEAYARDWALDAEKNTVDGRPPRFWKDVYECPTAAPLEALSAPLLSLWGECDWITTRGEHERIARCARRGEFRSVPGADHGLRACESATASLRGEAAGYAAGAAEAVARWANALG